MEKTDKFKILCIDGGGIKGLYTAKLLAMLEDTYEVRITDCFDMICGTSTGGLIALAASLGKPMSEVVDFYQRYGSDIFNQRAKRSKLGRTKLAYKQAMCKGKYDGTALKKALAEVFGSTRISESKNFLCIPSINRRCRTLFDGFFALHRHRYRLLGRLHSCIGLCRLYFLIMVTF
jgi:Patatin